MRNVRLALILRPFPSSLRKEEWIERASVFPCSRHPAVSAGNSHRVRDQGEQRDIEVQHPELHSGVRYGRGVDQGGRRSIHTGGSSCRPAGYRLVRGFRISSHASPAKSPPRLSSFES